MGLCDSVIKPKTNSEQTSNNNNLIPNKKINKNYISKKSSLTQFTLNKQKIIINNEILLSRNMSNPDLIYKKIKKISNGSYSEVWLVKHIKLQKTCTMKIINKNNEIENQEDSILNEINILKNLDHPNILKIIDFFITDKNYIIITDYYPEVIF